MGTQTSKEIVQSRVRRNIKILAEDSIRKMMETTNRMFGGQGLQCKRDRMVSPLAARTDIDAVLHWIQERTSQVRYTTAAEDFKGVSRACAGCMAALPPAPAVPAEFIQMMMMSSGNRPDLSSVRSCRLPVGCEAGRETTQTLFAAFLPKQIACSSVRKATVGRRVQSLTQARQATRPKTLPQIEVSPRQRVLSVTIWRGSAGGVRVRRTTEILSTGKSDVRICRCGVMHRNLVIVGDASCAANRMDVVLAEDKVATETLAAVRKEQHVVLKDRFCARFLLHVHIAPRVLEPSRRSCEVCNSGPGPAAFCRSRYQHGSGLPTKDNRQAKPLARAPMSKASLMQQWWDRRACLPTSFRFGDQFTLPRAVPWIDWVYNQDFPLPILISSDGPA